MTIPPLPDHPRFRHLEKDAQFLSGEGLWLNIAGLGLLEIEDCCCVAIVAWENIPERSTMFDPVSTWRDYKKEHCNSQE